MALEVIGAGFGRTGTLSMKAALETLGYNKCHHMLEVMSNGDQVNWWHDITIGKDPNWDAIFEGFTASVDFPSSIFYKELAEKYPEAKVVLTVRDFDKWYKSANETIYAISNAFPGWIKLIPRVRKTAEMANGLIWEQFFQGKFEDRAFAEKLFREHIENVKASIPAERLLVMEVKEGWEPLCAFLGQEIPDEPFPHVNETADFKKRIRMLERLAYVPWVAAGLAAVCGYMLLS